MCGTMPAVVGFSSAAVAMPLAAAQRCSRWSRVELSWVADKTRTTASTRLRVPNANAWHTYIQAGTIVYNNNCNALRLLSCCERTCRSSSRRRLQCVHSCLLMQSIGCNCCWHLFFCSICLSFLLLLCFFAAYWQIAAVHLLFSALLVSIMPHPLAACVFGLFLLLADTFVYINFP